MYYCTGEEKASVILFSQKAEEDHFRKSFHSFSEEKKWKPCQEKVYSGKSPEEPFSAKKVHCQGLQWCLGRSRAGEPGLAQPRGRASRVAPSALQRAPAISGAQKPHYHSPLLRLNKLSAISNTGIGISISIAGSQVGWGGAQILVGQLEPSHLRDAQQWHRVSSTSVPQTLLLQGWPCSPTHRGPGFLLPTRSKKGNLSLVPAPVKGWMNAARVLGPP